MEPKLPSPNLGPELPSVDYGQSLERGTPAASPETSVERGREELERHNETTAASAGPILPTPVVVAPSPQPVSDDVQLLPDDMPLVAGDDDLIEKEWVDKAKKIIVQTKDDPYRREQEVSRLQADYLRKRYGRELGAPQ